MTACVLDAVVHFVVTLSYILFNFLVQFVFVSCILLYICRKAVVCHNIVVNLFCDVL